MSAEALHLQISRDAEEAESDITRDQASTLPPVICYRDPADVRTIRRQSRLIVLTLLIVAVAVVGVVYKAIQKPDRIVVDMASGPAVMINNRELPPPDALSLDKDKLHLANM